MKVLQNWYYCFNLLVLLASPLCLAEVVALVEKPALVSVDSKEDDLVDDFDCVSNPEEMDTLISACDLALESFEQDIIAQFIEDFPNEEILFDEEDLEEDTEESEDDDTAELTQVVII